MQRFPAAGARGDVAKGKLTTSLIPAVGAVIGIAPAADMGTD